MNNPITTVSDLMTSDVFTLDEDDDFVSAQQIMNLRYIRHVPVVHGKKLVGLVTHRDFMRAQVKLLARASTLPADGEERVIRVKVAEFMTKDLLTCPADTPADDAMRAMLDKKSGCILVVDGEELLGILTEADVVQWAIATLAKQRYESVVPPPPDGGGVAP
jgi:CBS domain-containing protein